MTILIYADGWLWPLRFLKVVEGQRRWIAKCLWLVLVVKAGGTVWSQSPEFLDHRPTSATGSELPAGGVGGGADSVEYASPESDSEGLARSQLYFELANEADALQRHYSLLKRLVKTIQPTVVHIESKKQQKPASGRGNSNDPSWAQVEEAGSGVIFDYRDKLYIVTNYHVIEDSELADIRVEAEGRQFSPVNVRNDEETDLSVLYVDHTELQPAKIGDSDKMEIGDFVVAIGSPFGLSHSVSYGIISATGRRDLELGPHGVRYQNFLQTDAAINPGNSGGPLINLRGEVIGINTAIASNSGGNDGIGFSIPIKMVMRVAMDLIDYGAVRRGFLGVSLDARFSPEMAQAMGLQKAFGARVSAITPDSPADKVDIMVGDIVLEYNGVPVANDSHLVTEVSLSTIGSKVPVKVFRHGNSMTVTVTIEDRDGFQLPR